MTATSDKGRAVTDHVTPKGTLGKPHLVAPDTGAAINFHAWLARLVLDPHRPAEALRTQLRTGWPQ